MWTWRRELIRTDHEVLQFHRSRGLWWGQNPQLAKLAGIDSCKPVPADNKFDSFLTPLPFVHRISNPLSRMSSNPRRISRTPRSSSRRWSMSTCCCRWISTGWMCPAFSAWFRLRFLQPLWGHGFVFIVVCSFRFTTFDPGCQWFVPSQLSRVNAASFGLLKAVRLWIPACFGIIQIVTSPITVSASVRSSGTQSFLNIEKKTHSLIFSLNFQTIWIVWFFFTTESWVLVCSRPKNSFLLIKEMLWAS